MRWLLLLALAGCEAEAPQGSFVFDPSLGATARGLDPNVPILFLNRCADGCTIHPGADDSRSDHSSIVSEESFISPFPHGDVKWKQTLRCVQKLYEPFEIQVTDEDPGQLDHIESIVAGVPAEIGMAGIGGIAPFACEVVPNGINFNFAGEIDHPIALCNVVGQESGHTIGLDHQLLCDDPMTYLPSCGEKEFQRVDAECGEFDPRECYCGGEIQNSYIGMLKALGPRVTPVDYGPLVEIKVPEDDEEVKPLFRVFAEVDEDHGVDRVELFIDGIAIGTATAAPFGFVAPASLELGEHVIRVKAFDSAGQEDEDRIDVTLIERLPRPDAGTFDAGEFPGRRPRTEADAGIQDTGSEQVENNAGCTCVGEGRPVSLWWVLALIFVFPLGSQESRRGSSIWVRVSSWFPGFLIGPSFLIIPLLLSGCPDEGTLGRVAPIAVLTPPPGTPLVFEEVVLGKNEAEPRIVTTANEGDADLLISAHLESEGPIRVSSVNKRVIPGDDGEVFLRFEPAVHGTTENVLVVETNDPKLPEARYPVTGPARERCKLSAWPPYQRFRLHETREVSIFNDSLTDCEITRFFMEDEKLFKVLDAPAIPAVIPALGEMKLHVEHPRRTELAGPPVRQLHLKESDGTELIVSFEGALPLWDCLGVYPRKLEFPDTDLGVFNRQSAIVYSSCDEPAIVRSAHVGVGYYYFDVDQRQFPVIVPPFGEAEVQVDYFPFSEFGDSGRLSINTDDALNRQLRLELDGKALIPELLTIPRIDFGEAASSCSERIERVPLLAIGEARTIIKSLSIAGDPAFTVAGVLIDDVPLDDPTPPFTIPRGSSGHVLVRFAPAELDPEQREARLVVAHNGREQSRQIALVGRAVPAGPTIEQFIAPSAATVDVLFVIDDSRSMEREQDELQAAMSAFMGRVQAMGAPARFAVLAGEDESNAPGWPYRCPPHPYVIEPSYGDALSAMTCAVRVGYSSETPRAAIGSAIRGLARAIDPAAIPNPIPDFLRPDAELAVLFVSDEDDHSLASDLAFRDFLFSVKGSYRPDRASVHAIAGDPTTDCTLDPWLIPGVRYRHLARETGGTFADACTEDFTPLLTQLADTIFAPRDRFDLSRPADPASIVVQIAGATIAIDPIDGYTFDARSNSIQLHGAARPIAGDTVSIAYADACR